MADRTKPPPGLSVRSVRAEPGRSINRYDFTEAWTCGQWVDDHGHELWQIIGCGGTPAEAIANARKALKKRGGDAG